jgi:hypothetical protein
VAIVIPLKETCALMFFKGAPGSTNALLEIFERFFRNRAICGIFLLRFVGRQALVDGGRRREVHGN